MEWLGAELACDLADDPQRGAWRNLKHHVLRKWLAAAWVARFYPKMSDSLDGRDQEAGGP